ncbi:hypothetical protein ADIS_2811 [Lunatimonas lonarensis]|uniref:Uncharacterized protein n=1 Tax=Lunatimonas lonarensis TaxID=1232681 RepID=R7ZRF6_9BACT|nr:hypothetical protein ADIS_2811 [Lunatimonas lonarensis]
MWKSIYRRIIYLSSFFFKNLRGQKKISKVGSNLTFEVSKNPEGLC